MNDIERLEEKDVPMLAKAWIHNGEILGITREGKLMIVAKIVGEAEDSLFNPVPEVRRSHRKKKEVPLGPPEE